MCVFCKIINGDIPSYKIYEDDDVLAILDISQATKGHTLVMPKKHVENIFALDEVLMAKTYRVVNLISKHYQNKLPNLAGINLLNNNMEKAGQTVMHYHVHIIPRYQDDNLIDMKFSNNSKDIDFKELLDSIKING